MVKERDRIAKPVPKLSLGVVRLIKKHPAEMIREV
jgi:hypothetical protein